MVFLGEILPKKKGQVTKLCTPYWVREIVKLHIHAPASTQLSTQVDYST